MLNQGAYSKAVKDIVETLLSRGAQSILQVYILLSQDRTVHLMTKFERNVLCGN